MNHRKPERPRSWRNRFAGVAVHSLQATLSNIRAAWPGLLPEYFDNSDFTTLRLTTTNATADFDWGADVPAMLRLCVSGRVC